MTQKHYACVYGFSITQGIDQVYRPIDRLYQNPVYLDRVYLDRLYRLPYEAVFFEWTEVNID